jgi:hypothetical protein
MTTSNKNLVIVVLLTLILGGATMAFVSSEGAIYAARVSPEIEGTWLATITIPDEPPPFPSLLTYARGGALIATDSGVPPALGNVYQGTWTKIGAHKYAFTLLGFGYDETGVLTGYVRVHETLEFEPGGNAYNGVAAIEILDINQNVIGTGTSLSHARRINP